MGAKHMIVQIKILSSNGIALLFARGILTAHERDVPAKEAESWPSSLTHKSPLGDCAFKRVGWAEQKRSPPPPPLPARAASCQLMRESTSCNT